MSNNNGKIDTRDLILESAKKIFAHEGFHETSMAAIAREAGLGKGTLYWHFSGKQELFKELIKEEGERLVTEIHKLNQKEIRADKKIQEFIKIRFKRISHFKDNTLIFWNNENFINQEFMEELLKIRRSIVKELQDIIQKGIDENIFRIDTPEITAITIMGAVNSTSISLFLNNYDVKKMEEDTYNIIIKGIEKSK